MNFFGTDGIRGAYGSTVTDSTAFLLGKSLALLGEDCPIVLIARDTRPSGEKLFCALAQGVYAGGGNVINLGVLPTGAVGHFVRKMGGDFGVMITASHNPPQDNGLKVFDKYGVKLCPAKQQTVSRLMSSIVADNPCGKVFEPVFYDIENIYCDDVSAGAELSGLRIALDCCYGAACKVAPMLFERAGAKVTAFCTAKNGKINVGCGANNPEFLLKKMQKGGFRLGFAVDGDADRLAVFEDKYRVSDNKVFYAIAKYMSSRGLLRKNAVCGTTLTNGGVEKALADIGVRLLRSEVGDVNVFGVMAHNNLNFGGEPSGHYILSDLETGSDALVNALFLCKIFLEEGSLLAYTQECRDVPFVTRDVPLEEGRLATPSGISGVSQRVTGLFPQCRVVIRKSGTENKVRVYAEGENAQSAAECAAAAFCGVSLPQ